MRRAAGVALMIITEPANLTSAIAFSTSIPSPSANTRSIVTQSNRKVRSCLIASEHDPAKVTAWPARLPASEISVHCAASASTIKSCGERRGVFGCGADWRLIDTVASRRLIDLKRTEAALRRRKICGGNAAGCLHRLCSKAWPSETGAESNVPWPPIRLRPRCVRGIPFGLTVASRNSAVRAAPLFGLARAPAPGRLQAITAS
jgi:hypothetical protein